MEIKLNGENLTVFRTLGRRHDWIDLFVGKNCAERRISVPVHVYQNGGSVFTSGNRIVIKKGLK